MSVFSTYKSLGGITCLIPLLLMLHLPSMTHPPAVADPFTHPLPCGIPAVQMVSALHCGHQRARERERERERNPTGRIHRMTAPTLSLCRPHFLLTLTWGHSGDEVHVDKLLTGEKISLVSKARQLSIYSVVN